MFGDQISNLFAVTMCIGCNPSENEKNSCIHFIEQNQCDKMDTNVTFNAKWAHNIHSNNLDCI